MNNNIPIKRQINRAVTLGEAYRALDRKPHFALLKKVQTPRQPLLNHLDYNANNNGNQSFSSQGTINNDVNRYKQVLVYTCDNQREIFQRQTCNMCRQ